MHNLTLQDLRSTVNARVDIPQNIVMRLSTVERFARVSISQHFPALSP